MLEMADEEQQRRMKTKPKPMLKGDEPWLVAGLSGSTVWGQEWGGDERPWRPIIFVGMDTGLCHIDVMGQKDNRHLDDFARIRVNDEEPIPHGEYCDYQREPAEA
jgi:hypothetical protein